MSTLLERIKSSEINVPLFLVISTSYLLAEYDVDCVPYLGSLVSVVFWVNLFGSIIIGASIFKKADGTLIGFVLTGLDFLYILINALVFFAVLLIFILKKAIASATCKSDDVLEMYFLWMLATLAVIVIRALYRKWKLRAKLQEDEGLIIRGSYNPDDPVLRTSVRGSIRETIK